MNCVIVSTLVYISFQVLYFSVANGQACTTGSFIDASGSCELCPVGTYQNKPNQRSCTPCSPGTFNPYRGAQGQDLCRKCAAGTFSSGFSSTKCTPCEAGTSSRDGFSLCLSCGPGETIDFNNEYCSPCQSGTYGTDGTCTRCPDNQYSAPGSTSIDQCTPCSPGFEMIGRCSACDSRQFRSADMERCAFCPWGTTTIRTGASSCDPCPRNTFKNSVYRYGCAPCEEGKVSNPGAIMCRPDDGSECPGGTFEDRNGNCASCAPGEIRNLETNQCQRCGATEFSTGGISTKCEKCGKNAVQTFNGDGCICRDGRQFAANGKSCELCPPGTHGTCPLPLGMTCYMCREGRFNPNFGATECEDCPPGLTTLEKGGTKCVKCPDGLVPRTQNIPFSEPCVVPQTNCPRGFERVTNARGLIRRCKKVESPSPSPKPQPVPVICRRKCYGQGRKIIKCKWRGNDRCLITFVNRVCNLASKSYISCAVGRRIVPRSCMDACMALPYWQRRKLQQS